MLIQPRRRRPDRGASLVEVVAALVILLLLSAVVVPGVARPMDRERVADAAHELLKITDAMETMRSDNQDWPRRLRHMALPITNTDNNICGNNYVQGKVNNWDGPYLDRVVPPTGLDIGIGVVQDSIVRDPPQGTGPGGSQIALMIMVIEGVTEEDAVELDRLVDGGVGPAAGAVQWTYSDPGAGLVTVEYIRRTKGC